MQRSGRRCPEIVHVDGNGAVIEHGQTSRRSPATTVEPLTMASVGGSSALPSALPGAADAHQLVVQVGDVRFRHDRPRRALVKWYPRSTADASRSGVDVVRVPQSCGARCADLRHRCFVATTATMATTRPVGRRGCMSNDGTVVQMSRNKQTVETYIDGFNKSDHAQILSCLDRRHRLDGVRLLHGCTARRPTTERPRTPPSPATRRSRSPEWSRRTTSSWPRCVGGSSGERRTDACRDGRGLRHAIGKIDARRAYVIELVTTS